ncbi:MAG TPA: biotin-dependent carboxyltransferase family protein [Xanthobacteraceae bacterium]|nr:biotin-dependent carboxyltransferase family protein [Xanthobacteraceae bacterium]
MSAALRVVGAGLLTTVQDLGRAGYQSLGIPVSGALDPIGLRAANALVGNNLDAGALEVAYVGPTIAVEADDVRLSFVGARATIDILPDAAATTGTRIETMRSIRVRRGEVVRIGSLSGGAVLYVAVEGGFDIPPVLGSVSTYLRGGFGGWQGRALVAGDRLPLCRSAASERDECRIEGLDLSPPARVRAIAGPQNDYFSEAEIGSFFAGHYTVCAGSDRMGMRLQGKRLDHARGYNITSDGIAAGSIQVPGDGQPIVLLADRQTTGGYPKIATVISADLPALGRLPIGAKIAFEHVSVEAAQALRRVLFSDIERIGEKIVPIGRVAADMAPMLLDNNLISGVVDAHNWTP